MATKTSNLQLTKPELTDPINPQVFADNFDRIDDAISDPSKLTNGTLGGEVVANAGAVSITNRKQLRNIFAGEDDLAVNISELATGDIYVVYE